MTVGRLYSNYKGPIVMVVIIAVGLGIIFLIRDNRHNGQSATNAASVANNQLVIKELNVQLTLPDILAGTTAKTATSAVSANFKPPAIVNLIQTKYSIEASSCLGVMYNYSTPYASLSKISGEAKPNDTQLMKQFNGFYIERVSAGLTVACKDQTTQAALDDLNNRYEKAVKDAFSNAQPI